KGYSLSSLADHLVCFHADARRVAALMEKIARAVQYMHEKGVLHRDLKPSNVLLDENGEPLVSDFGVAKLRDADTELTRTGDLLGTPTYMAPEQIIGQNELVGAATDIWALGILLFELLTGRRPFVTRSRDEAFHLIRHTDPPRLRSLRGDLDRKLE